MARGTPKKVVVELLLARPRQKSWRVKPAMCPGLFHVEHFTRLFGGAWRAVYHQQYSRQVGQSAQSQ
jgi:hypothetical protein